MGKPGGARRLTRIFTLTAAVAGLALSSAVAAPAGTAEGAIPGVDEIVHSPNLRQLANLPHQAPFTSPVGTDIAFTKDHAIVGNYDGFVIYDIKNPARPKIVSQVLCPGGQNDVSVSGDLLFLSTDSSRSDSSCNSVAQPASIKESWEGIKVFNIKDLAHPKYVAAVETDCGSHTHTLVPDNKSRDLYLYVSSYAPAANLPDCLPPHDKISIVKVPVDHPEQSAVVAKPLLFPDGGNPGGPNPDGTNRSATTGCHDLTSYPQKDVMAGACMGDGMLWDIKDRLNPRVLDRVQDTNFAFWHSATFNNAGTKVIFTDELGGGGMATCLAKFGSTRGADGIYDIKGRGDKRKLEFKSYFKIPRLQAENENCVAHNGSLIPTLFGDYMVQSWYQGGVSVWDFTDSAHPKEIAFWERGPLEATGNKTGGTWSAYYYNGYIYSSDIVKGFDVLELRDWRTATAKLNHYNQFNPQTQPHYGLF
ncbi:hypothetical protein SAMN05421504_104791 [Amycolatopsis xylanica]|uniref:LVIVD repeat-containing protein n=1 Tax=Amycolatopsis xylanica TaxID=589385 RepID=A0A1H3HTL6_9PSEU|nr:hypothetical protein [Amycolatopsis xylanica]SDY18104.1 hypothetical protein SAMN05421504_104791 [Amycolatopsis xylanica]